MRSGTYPHVVQFETRARLVGEAIAHERAQRARARGRATRAHAERGFPARSTPFAAFRRGIARALLLVGLVLAVA